MANYATNIFYASTENEKDLDRVENFLEDTFCDCYLDRSEDSIEGEFSSKWDYPEKEINKMISLLENKDKIYIRVLTHELCNEYVNFQVFSNGEWCLCTLLTPYKGHTEGEVMGDYGNEIVVRLTNGKEVVEYRDEVLIYD